MFSDTAADGGWKEVAFNLLLSLPQASGVRLEPMRYAIFIVSLFVVTLGYSHSPQSLIPVR